MNLRKTPVSFRVEFFTQPAQKNCNHRQISAWVTAPR